MVRPYRFGWMLILLAVGILLPAVSRAQSPDGTGSFLLPLSRVWHSAIYDPVRDRMLVFGGSLDQAGQSSEVWQFSPASPSAWSRVTTAGGTPPPLSLHSAIYDPDGDRMIVFGGKSDYSTHDVWALSLAGVPTWTHMAPQGTPPSDRYSALAVYDAARHRMIVFGGLHASFSEPYAALNDVWALTLGPNPSWTELLPSGDPPVARYYHSKGGIYDPAGDRMIVFGGNTYSSIYLNDVWALNLSGEPAWVRLGPQGGPPAPRTSHTAIYDAARSRMLVYGGMNGGGDLGDLWALALNDPPVWSQVTPSGAIPRPRDAQSAIFDPVRDRMIVYGNSFAGDVDAWSLSLSATPEWNALAPATFPPERSSDVTVLDPIRRRIVVFGGQLRYGTRANDTWILPLGSVDGWTPLATSGTTPPTRSGSAGVYDPARDRILVFGGDMSAPDDVVWSLAPGTAEWSALPTTGAPPSPRSGHSLVYDTRRDRLLLYGGKNLDDLWSLSLAAAPAVWKQLSPAGSPPPPAVSHAAFYDAYRDRMLVFGRIGGSFEVWELSLRAESGWQRLAPSGTPPAPRDYHTIVFDSRRNRVLLSGGVTTSSPPNPRAIPFHDVWAFDLALDGAWSQPAVIGDSAPGLWAHGSVYDPSGDRMIVCSGLTGSYGSLLAVTWELQFHGSVGVTPAPSRLSLLIGARPNPSARAMEVSFTLPSAGAARIEVIDAAGRRIVSREVGSFGPGTHFIRLEGGSGIRPGIYFLRLTQGGRTASARVAVID
jgi:galactose oxidase-like protein